MPEVTDDLMNRLPFATAVLKVLDVVSPPAVLQRLWDQHRGRCYQDVLSFGALVGILRDALVFKDNTVHRQFVQMEAAGEQPADESNFYRKLSRMPEPVSLALLAHSGNAVAALMPAVKHNLPESLSTLEVVGIDGKTIKHVQHRMKVTRMVRSKIVGAKTLVAMNLRTGVAMAASASLDGMANEITLVPALLEPLHASVGRPMLLVCDRQFDSYDCLKQFTGRPGDQFLVRVRNSRSMPMTVIHSVKSVDPQGRAVLDEQVRLDKTGQVLRRITLARDEGTVKLQAVTLLSSLLDASACPAADLLALYRRRWGIEQLFQQVTQTFELGRLIGSSAKATLMQFSFCMVIYNAMQLLRAWLADDGGVPVSAVSMCYLFDQTRQELCAWRLVCAGVWHGRPGAPAAELKPELQRLLRGRWHPKRFGKQSDKKPRPPRPKRHPAVAAGRVAIHRLQTQANTRRTRKE